MEREREKEKKQGQRWLVGFSGKTNYSITQIDRS
jgi:hypothetical protein